MHGEFDGGIKLSEEEQNRKIKRCEKQFGKAVKRCNEFNKINKELRREGQRSPTQPCHPCCQQQRQQCHPAAAAAYTVWHVHAHFYVHACIYPGQCATYNVVIRMSVNYHAAALLAVLAAVS